MYNPKIIIFSAIGGFFLSFIFGLLSQVIFSTLLLRAFISAFIFSLITFGISFLIDRFHLFAKVDLTNVFEASHLQSHSSKKGFQFIEESLPDTGSAPAFNLDQRKKTDTTVIYDESSFQAHKEPVSTKQSSEITNLENTFFNKTIHKETENTDTISQPVNLINKNTPKQPTADSNADFFPKGLVAEKITTSKKKTEFAYAHDTESISKAIQTKLAKDN
ncbi:MAG: hypothetical protein ACRC4W_09315 [Treponemataceae bacterium]